MMNLIMFLNFTIVFSEKSKSNFCMYKPYNQCFTSINRSFARVSAAKNTAISSKSEKSRANLHK